MVSGVDDFKNPVHAGEFENLLDRWAGVQKSNCSLAAAGRFVDGNEGAEATAIYESRLGQIEFDVPPLLRQRRLHLVAHLVGIGSAQFFYSRNSYRIAIEYQLHKLSKQAGYPASIEAGSPNRTLKHTCA
jgi:hypothetical protein